MTTLQPFVICATLYPRGSPGGSEVKACACNAETRVQCLSREDPLEKEMAAHSSTLAWRIPWRSLVGYSPWGRKELDTTEQLHLHTHGSYYYRHYFYYCDYHREQTKRRGAEGSGQPAPCPARGLLSLTGSHGVLPFRSSCKREPSGKSAWVAARRPLPRDLLQQPD